MFEEITYALLGGIPFIVYLGIITLIFFIITLALGGLHMRRLISISVKWHFRLAYFSILLGLIHGILGVLAYV